jgi:hypothetical protein
MFIPLAPLLWKGLGVVSVTHSMESARKRVLSRGLGPNTLEGGLFQSVQNSEIIGAILTKSTVVILWYLV